MFYAIYRWRLNEGMEEAFVGEWKRVTEEIYKTCGSYGSRLHKSEDGTYVAYAAWSSKEARRKCWDKWDNDKDLRKVMEKCVKTKFPDIFMEDISDLLKDKL